MKANDEEPVSGGPVLLTPVRDPRTGTVVMREVAQAIAAVDPGDADAVVAPAKTTGGRHRSRVRAKLRVRPWQLVLGAFALLNGLVWPSLNQYQQWRAERADRAATLAAADAEDAGLIITGSRTGTMRAGQLWAAQDGTYWLDRSSSRAVYIVSNSGTEAMWVYGAVEVEDDGSRVDSQLCGPHKVRIEPGQAVPFVFQKVEEPQQLEVHDDGTATSTTTTIGVAELLVVSGTEDEPVRYVERDPDSPSEQLTQALADEIEQYTAACDLVPSEFGAADVVS